MKKTIISLLATVGASAFSVAAPYFHTEFDEASLDDIAGLNIDMPNTVGADSGTVTLDTVTQSLDMTSNGANLWADREGAPIAWVASPVVAVGETWFVETQVTHTDSAGDNSGYDQAGITFYSGTAGANPGSENTGVSQSLMLGINDWNAWAHRIQGLADNDPNVTAMATVGDDTFEYRVEITENGDSDIYNFFYREDPADAWTQFGDVDFEQDFDNTAVGLFMKSHNNNTTASTEFAYLTVDVMGSTAGTLQVQSIDYDSGTGLVTLTWNGEPGAQYTVLYSRDPGNLQAGEFGDGDVGDSFEDNDQDGNDLNTEEGQITIQFDNPDPTARDLFFSVHRN